jgi:hypothetical protein
LERYLGEEDDTGKNSSSIFAKFNVLRQKETNKKHNKLSPFAKLHLLVKL